MRKDIGTGLVLTARVLFIPLKPKNGLNGAPTQTKFYGQTRGTLAFAEIFG